MTRKEIYNLFEPPRFTRSWWLSRGRSLLWVAVVTVLVWIYADVEFIDEMELRATVHLQTPPDSSLVLRSRSRVDVTFKAQGRRSSLERLDRRLRAAAAAVQYEVTEDDGEIPTRDILSRDPFIENEGLTILSASPAVLYVELDSKIHVPGVPVEADFGGAFVSEQQVEPATTGIRVSRNDWQKVLSATPEPVLRTVRVDLKSVEPGKPFVRENVQIIRRIGDVPVEPDLLAVRVSGKVTQLTEPQDLAVPVRVVTPSTWLEDQTWKTHTLVRRDRAEWRAQIQVSGTRKDLDQLRAEDVLAYIVLTDDDKKPVASWLTREVEVRLPRRLDLKLLGAPPTVSFKLEKAPSAGTP